MSSEPPRSDLSQAASPDEVAGPLAAVPVGRGERLRGYLVHLYTASGIVPAYLAMAEIVQPDCDPRWVFGWLLVTVAIDATDGPLARAWHVHRTAPQIDGRTIDDLLDYLTFAFIPLLLVARMGWLPEGTGWTVSLAMGASLLGFSHRSAKQESAGFFRGFPSYWNIYAFYAGLLAAWTPWLAAALMWILALATVAPLRMVYPNLAPRPWKLPILAGAAVWTLLMVAMLPSYPQNSPIWILLSLVYPLFYAVVSCWLDWQDRRRAAAPESVA